MKSKQKSPFILSFMIFVLAGYAIITGIIPYFSTVVNIQNAFDIGLVKGNSYEGEIKYSSQCVCEYSHTLNFIIPIGTEYYYIAFSEDQSKAAVIRADKNFGDSFNKDTGAALSAVNVSGRVEKTPMQVKTHISKLSREVLTGFPTSENFKSFYINLISDRNCTFRLISGIGFIISGIIMTLFFIKVKKEDDSSLKFKKISEVSAFVKYGAIIGSILLMISIVLFIISGN